MSKVLPQTIERFQLSGFPLTIGHVCELAFQYAHVNGIQGFSEETQLAGRKWLQGFLSWHPQITLKKAHNLSIARAMGANPTVIGSWFTLLDKIKKTAGITSPDQIWCWEILISCLSRFDVQKCLLFFLIVKHKVFRFQIWEYMWI